MSASKPFKVPFGYFECPSCGLRSWHLWVLYKGFREYAWCPSCTTYFLRRNVRAFGLLLGVVGTALAGVFTLIAVEIWTYDVRPSVLSSVPIGVVVLIVGEGIALLIVFALIPQIARWTIRYEDVGHDPP